MKRKAIDLPLMLLRETLCSPRLARQPEPSIEMDNPDNIAAFHEQGQPSGPLLPIYHFNAMATSRLLPKGGTLLDLGSGSGQYLAYLARCRPDIRIVGVELASGMIEKGQIFLQEEHLEDRIELRQGDMTRVSTLVPEPVHAISSVFSLHHLPSDDDLSACLKEISTIHHRCGCACWIFDHARPRHPLTPAHFPKLFTPEAPEIFQEDSKNSLIASWSFNELTSQLIQANLERTKHALAKLLPLYQAHWLETDRPASIPDPDCKSSELPEKAIRAFNQLRRLFPSVPLTSCA